MLGAVEADQLVVLVILLVSSLLNIAYLMPVVIRGFFYAPLGSTDTDSYKNASGPLISWGALKEAPALVVAPPMLTALGCIALFFAVDPIYQLILPIVTP